MKKRSQFSSFFALRSAFCVLFFLFRFVRLERLNPRLSLGISEDQLDLFLNFLEFLIAKAREADALFEELQRFVEGQLFTLQTLDDLFQLLERLLEFVCFQPCRHSATQSLTPWSLRQPCIPGGPF